MHTTLGHCITCTNLQMLNCEQYLNTLQAVYSTNIWYGCKYTHIYTAHTPSVDEAVSTVGVSASDVAEGVVDVSLLVTGGSGRPESVVTVPVGG